MKALKLALAAALALSLASADGEAKEFKFSGAKTSALLAKCSKKDAAACYEMAMRYELGGRGVVRNHFKAQGFFADACELATLAEWKQRGKTDGAGGRAMSNLRERACLGNAAALESFASGQCRSLVIYDELCEGGSQEACDNLARMKREGWAPKESCSEEIVAKFGDGKPQK